MQISITLIEEKGEKDITVNSRQVVKDTMRILGVKAVKAYSQRQGTEIDMDRNFDDNGIFYGDKLEVKA